MADPKPKGWTIQQLPDKEQWVLACAVEYRKMYNTTHVPTTGLIGQPGLADLCTDAKAHPHLPKDWLNKPDATSLVRNANRRLRSEKYFIKTDDDGVHTICELSDEQLDYLAQVFRNYD